MSTTSSIKMVMITKIEAVAPGILQNKEQYVEQLSDE